MVVRIFATMKNGQKAEDFKSFPLQWQTVALTQCRAVGGLLRHLRAEAGLNPRYIKLDSDKPIGIDKFVRIEINKALLQDKNAFLQDWESLGILLYEVGNTYGDIINLNHKRKKNKT